MKEINVNNMVQGIKQNMSTIRYIRILFIMLALFVGTASEAWAYEKLDPVNGITVYVDKTPSNIGGTIVVSEVVDDTDTDGKKVTLTITPPTGYSISENLITAVPVKNISTTRTGTPDLMEDPLDITGEGSNKYSFVLPAAYTAAYVKVAFKQGTIDENIKFIRSLSEITDPNKQYEMVADIDASGFDGFDFKDANNNPLPFSGTLDGGLFKIKKLSTPLFATINDGTVKNVILEGVNISSGDSDGDAGAICCKAEGTSRIYNCGILPTSVVRNDPEDAKKITGFSGSSVSGDRYVGGLVGFLDGTARVINCFSYANITGGTNVGGIVGYNNQTTTSANGNQKTMVMNCMFYGDITGGSNKAPIYNGTEISNAGDNGVGNYNYFWGGASYVTGTNNNPDIQTYNCALLAETRFLQRFEFFRHLLNSHLQLAEWWVTGTPYHKDKSEMTEMMKWVLEPSQLDADSKCPFPILKVPGYYPSVVNIDAENAPTTTERNKGGRLGTLSVSIRMGSGGEEFGPPTGATITRSSLTLTITDKDPDHYNFNYGKVQLPYYNDVGTKNYNGYRVVTGWKIVSITGGTPGSFTQGEYDATADADGNITKAPYNFADRHCTNKDLYGSGGSNRVFNQGAYWDVPEGVTAITIEPYWAKAAYVADSYADVVYSTDMKTRKNVSNVGGGQIYTNGSSYSIAGESQKVFTSIKNAVEDANGLNKPTSNTVNDYAVVLVGNVHQYTGDKQSIGDNYKYTVTTIDLDGDNEPDYSFMLRDDNRNDVHPLKWDFLNLVGLGMAQKSTGGTGTYNLGILCLKGWFEVTNTALFRVTQMEYEHSSRTSTDAIILQGGVMEQWVSYNQKGRSNNIPYIHVGGNVWFKEFHTGCHQDKNQTSGGNQFQPTKHSPISVTGGDFDEFYLTGLYVANSGMNNYADNAECYINGGQFGIVCGAAMEGIGTAGGNDGNIIWQIQNADIKEFYAGGLNAAKPVEGNLTTVIEGGYIKQFCGGPKFGDMNIGKTVKTTAKDCTFDTFYGAGYGGNSYNRYAPSNINNINGDYGTNNWNTFLNNNYKKNYKEGYGVSVTYSTQYLPMSNNYQNVARLLVDYVSFSLAKTRDVTSKLTGCTINKNFYGGGNLGMVDGPVTSTLTDCTVTESVFGAGYSGTLPKVEVRNTGNFVKAPFYNQNLGTYFDPDVPGSEEYTWEHVASVTSSNAIDTNGKKLRTDKDLTTLGTVTGQVTLNIEGTTTVGGCVYGGGAESDVQYKDDDIIKTASTRVNVNGGTISKDVYGGGMGEKTVVANDVEVNIGKAPEGNETAYTGSATIKGSVYGGSAFGAVNARSTKAPDGNVTEYYPQNGKTTKVNVLKGTVNGSVFGGGLGQRGTNSENPGIAANVYGPVTVTVEGGTAGKVFGCNDQNGAPQSTVAVLITNTAAPTTEIPNPIGSVYGGGNLADYTGSPTVRMDNGTVGYLYGGGLGSSAIITGNTSVTLTNGTVKNDVYGGGEEASVTGTVTVNIQGGTVTNDVYGGGALADTNTANWVSGNLVYSYLPVTGLTTGTSSVDGYYTLSEGVYSPASGKAAANTDYYEMQNTTAVNLVAGTINGNVYGGGLGRKAKAAVDGQPAQGTEGDEGYVPAVPAQAAVTAVEALVYGNVTLKLNDGVDPAAKGCVVKGKLFGCNNVNGTPKGNVEVHVYATQSATTDKIQTKARNKTASPITGAYDVVAVYGGGNEAAYVPESPYNGTTGSKSQVIIEGCNYTSIETVYGGGNAAAVPESNVQVLGAYEIGYVYGGGNGKDNLSDGTANPGADIGQYNNNGTLVTYGTGIPSTTLTAGYIHEAYGGSNQKGVIKGSINLVTNPIESSATGYCCDLALEKVVGAGKYADIEGDVILVMGCMPESKTAEVFGGADEANVKGNVELTITSGTFGKVFGGNNLGGAILGHIILNIEETGCHPIKIDELYLGGNQAAYSIYGYYDSGTTNAVGKPVYLPRTSASDAHTAVTNPATDANHSFPYAQPVLNVISCTYIGKVFGGGLGVPATMYANPTVSINMIPGTFASSIPSTTDNPNKLGEIGTVYGGGNAADVVGDPTVNIGTAATVDLVSTSTTGNTVLGAYITGNVFGGGMGKDDTFTCEKAMVGKDGDGINNPDGGTTVNIGNGIVMGNVYGGGEIGRVEKNTVVTIGLESGTGTPVIKGDVFGGGKGLETHGYAALVRGNPTVTIQGKAKIGHNVYGGGEIASVARYKVPKTPEEVAAAIAEGYDAVLDMPYVLADPDHPSGKCKVIVKGDAEIGPDNMQMTKADGPDDMGHVFGAGKGILPKEYSYTAEDDANMPKRMINENGENKWQYFHSQEDYITFIQTLALSSYTEVSIEGNAFVKGSVYGGSENGLVQFDTKVYIKNGQIGNGDGVNGRYSDSDWSSESLAECASWKYGIEEGEGDNKKTIYAPYDPYANATGDLDQYSSGKSTAGGRRVASDGHTFYGNVFGGGSGSVPYFDTTEGISKYLPSAGLVRGDSYVEISGGHILTNVYGGNEATNVLGTAHVTMTGGSIGVPRTAQQIKDHPVTCYLFGAGKGDQRIYFNKETNVKDAIVKVEGGRIYGSVFGGGEDGHVLRNTSVTIGKTDGAGPTIGTVGSTYVDGNVFGGGRGFGGEALTAGNVGGSVDLTINGGTMLGSIYGGGRLASVGYGLYLTTEKGFGANNDDGYGKMQDDGYSDWTKGEDGQYTRTEISGFKRGYITVTVNGGTIGKEFANDAEGEHSGNVFGGSMGRLTKLDGTPFDRADHWALLATAKSTTVNINGGTIKRSVYGGGEMGTVTTNATVNVSGGTIGTSGKGGAEFGNVYGGGKGYVDPAGSNYVTAGIIKGNTKVTINSGTNGEPKIYHNIYGGGAYGSVGTITYGNATYIPNQTAAVSNMPTAWERAAEGTTQVNTGTAEVYVYGGTIGTNGDENGMIFGSSRGDVGAPNSIHDKLAWVYDANVVIGTSSSNDGPQIRGSVYGSGENGHTFNDAKVTLHSGTIGISSGETIGSYSGAAYPYRGNLYGGGCGTDQYDSNNDGTEDSYNALAGVVYGDTQVTINGGQVVRNVYGAGAMGSVGKTVTTEGVSKTTGGLATISISGGQIGVDGTAGDGNVFGAARGDADATSNEFALVRKETRVSVTGGNVKGNVYGGGELGCVGTYTMSSNMRTFTWQDTDCTPNTAGNSKNTGLCNVTINGSSAVVKGNVFGAGKGKDDTFWCEKGIAYSTDVSVINGTVNGNVYGGGEVGRVETDAKVKIGIAPGEGGVKSEPTINGSVFGGGAGVETHGYSALVRGNTTVTVDQYAHVGHSVYGGGEIASVGKYGLDEHKMPSILQGGGYCYVTVKGNAAIADDVYGAGKGVTPHFDKDNTDQSKRSRRMTLKNEWESLAGDARFDWDYFQTESDYSTYLETLALATHPEVTIDESANISGSVFGGGELGLTKGSVIVTIKGGTIAEDVYGGGSLANTNTTSTVDLDGDGKTETVHPTTKVSLLGGTIEGDAYGGGLGRKEYGTKGQAGYESPVEATVFGDVLVELNNNNNGGDADGSKKGCAVTRVFGCNNLNGTPKGKVKVYVYATQKKGAANLSTKADKNTNTYDVRAVYGGGNLSPYEPDDALWVDADDYAANKAKVDAARPEVTIDGCDLTSIETVYGGGNAAPVPATYVVVERCYEINEVFGGGNGADDYSLTNGTNTVWYKNPGANVGYYDYTRLVTDQDKDEDGKFIGTGSGTEADPYKNIDKENARTKVNRQYPDNHYMYGSGIATTEIKGGTIHTVYGGSNSRGNVRTKLSSSYSGMFDDCPMVINTTYGSGKNAESDGEVEVLSDCAKGISVMFGGAENADVDNDINLIITNGSSLQRVFGGNNTSGAINGSITVTIKEGGCEPIRIGELYAGGFLAPYSIYGYKKTNGVYDTEEVEYFDENDNTVKKKLQRIPLESASEDVTPKANPRINVISATRIDNIFGGGYQAKLVGSPHINVNMEPGRILAKYVKEDFVGEHKDTDGNVLWTGDHIVTEDGPEKGDGILAIGTIGNVYGGGNMADIVGNTYVEIGTGTEHNDAGELVAITPVRNAATITGNVFGGGKGKADTFTCEKAVIGIADSPDKTIGNTHVTIGNGTVGTLDDNEKLVEGTGNVYGGGEIGRVENNTNVTLGIENGTGPDIRGCVFGAGAGVNTHGYSALVRGDATVLIQGNTKVGQSVYGGGEIASVGRYKVADAAYHAQHPDVEIGLPYSTNEGGICTVTIKGNAEIGPDNMKMVTDTGWPTDQGHVFGAGKGVLPYELTNTTDNRPRRMWRVKSTDTDWNSEWDTDFDGYIDDDNIIKYKDIWEYYDGEGQEPAYLKYIQSLALTTTTEVTIEGNAFVKGSVYGGSMNGHVQANTHVVIDGDCQIGNGDGVNRRYTTDEWASQSLAECASWPYGHDTGTTDENDNKIYEYLSYDVYDYQPGTTKPKPASDGHTYYGNVFGGGSGLFPYKQDPDWAVVKEALGNKSRKDLGYSDGVWLRSAGAVYGNTHVEIKGGHVLTSVYGGNECTDVKGTTTVEMSGGTLGVPRTPDEIKKHPVTCYLFGAGKGDQRINFNTWTNVEKAIVKITGGHIFGSVFGGGEDGHVLGDVEMTISGGNTKIGTTGTSYVDGNIFGGGRGFSGDAQTAGTVGGDINMTISGGEILGSIYGGGRLASVGTEFTDAESPNYGNIVEDGEPIYYTQEDADAYNQENNLTEGMEDYKTTESIKIPATTHGHITINISGGIIGNTVGNAESGNVFGGSMGRLNLLNGNINPIWPKMAQVKETNVTISGDAVIKRNVYGGGELGTVRDNATVNINGGTVNRDVYGAGYGSKDYETKTKITVKEPDSNQPSGYKDQNYVFTPMIFAGCVGQNTYVNIAGGQVKKSVYGGGEMASVGIMDCRVKIDNNATDPVYTEGTDKYVYEHFHSHLDENNGFALSWPFHFENSPGYIGATHVNITGGRIGLNGEDNKEENNPFEDLDNGDVYGGGKGIAGEYKNYVYCANVGSAEVTIAYPAGNTATPSNYMESNFIECIAGAVYGGAENGHVMGDTKLTLKNGLIGHSMYGGGSGKGTFTTTLNKITGVTVKTNNTPTSTVTPPTQTETTYDAEIYSITAGKVFGNTNVVMNGGYVVRNVYGGGNLGSVGKGNYAGGTDDYSYYNNGARSGYGETLDGNLWDKSSDPSKAFMNSGVSNVTINGGTVGYIDFDNVSGYTYSGLPYGNVFGGCRGESAPNIGESPRYLYCPTFFSGYVNETNVTIGAANSSEGPKIWGSVYGGGMDGHVRRDATVTINSGEIGRAYDGDGSADDLAKIEWSQCGNVYGAGSGIGQYNYDFNYDGDYEDVVEYTNPETGRASTVKERDFSTSAGSVTRFTKVEVKGGKIHRNVYGGGSLSSVGAPKIPPTRQDDPIRRNDNDKSTQGLQSLNEVIISGSTTTIGDATSYDANGNHVYGGFVFGASRGDETLSNPTSFASSAWTDVKVQGGTIYGDVYGGGEVGTVRQGTEVQLTGGVIGSVKGDKVVGGDVFGGGKGTSTVAADVGGDVLVELNKGVAEGDPGCVVDRIYGANNINGTPKGHVKVHVYATQNRDLATYANITAKKENVTSPEPPASDFDMTGVFGGGKSSDYVPADTDTKQSTEVIIEGCKLTSIYEVYGGGYGASTPGTNVLINGTKIIDKVFGGGYGKSTTDIPNNPGANIGYRTVGKTPYGSHINDEEKIAIVQLKAGKVNSVFGGSNTLGDIRNGSSITTLTSDEAGTQTDDPCEILEVGELYGGGNEAVMEGGAEIVLRCMPDSWIGEVYAGARKADVGNDVSLTITSGKFEQVFGGNKSDGKIDGYVEVNIEECPTCNTPVIIGELYGGGNEAEYTYPELDDDPNYPSPRVNVRAFTSIGTIYGGGKGKDAVVNGNPTVNVSVGMVDGGGQDYSGETRTVDGKDIQLYGHEKGKIGVIGDIFGGGNAAEVNGNTNVFIGTEKYVKLDRIVPGETDVSNYYIRTGTSSNYEYTPVPRTKATAAGTYYQRNQTGTYTEVSVSAGDDVSGFYTRSGEGTEVSPFVYAPVSPAQSNTVYCLPVLGADIQGNVYGGGNAAKVTGHTNVVIGKKQE